MLSIESQRVGGGGGDRDDDFLFSCYLFYFWGVSPSKTNDDYCLPIYSSFYLIME